MFVRIHLLIDLMTSSLGRPCNFHGLGNLVNTIFQELRAKHPVERVEFESMQHLAELSSLCPDLRDHLAQYHALLFVWA